jgi:hypothetical protein
MTARAAAASLERCTAAAGVARLHGAAVCGIHVAKIGDDPGELGGVELERQHTSAADAIRDHAREILIGHSIPKCAAAEIHGSDSVTVRAVARGALRVVQARAVRNVHLRVFADTHLRGILDRDKPRARPRQSEDSPHEGADRACMASHGTNLYLMSVVLSRSQRPNCQRAERGVETGGSQENGLPPARYERTRWRS